jgi:hypothetical protein
MTDKHFILFYDDYGQPLHILHIAHTEEEAKRFAEDIDAMPMTWVKGDIEQIGDADVLLYCFGDAQYVILEWPQ